MCIHIELTIILHLFLEFGNGLLYKNIFSCQCSKFVKSGTDSIANKCCGWARESNHRQSKFHTRRPGKSHPGQIGQGGAQRGYGPLVCIISNVRYITICFIYTGHTIPPAPIPDIQSGLSSCLDLQPWSEQLLSVVGRLPLINP